VEELRWRAGFGRKDYSFVGESASQCEERKMVCAIKKYPVPGGQATALNKAFSDIARSLVTLTK